MTLTPLEFDEQFVRLCWEWDMGADGEQENEDPASVEKMNSIKARFLVALDTGEKLFNEALVHHAEMPKSTANWKAIGSKLATIQATLSILRSIATGL